MRTSAPAKSAPRSYTGYAGSPYTTTFFGECGSTSTCASEKIASFEPYVGMISVSGIELDAEAARAPAGRGRRAAPAGPRRADTARARAPRR